MDGRYYLEYGGGLGDVFNQMYHRGSYNILRDLKEGETARIAIISHNRFVRELFEWHPKASQFEIVECGYWCTAEEDRVNRQRFGLPPHGSVRLPEKDRDIQFYPAATDLGWIGQMQSMQPYVVLSASAGLPDRDIPFPVVQGIVRQLTEAGLAVVSVGRTYDRHGRAERHGFSVSPLFLDLVDSLTVPGTAELLRHAAGLVTCHSSLNILGWHLNKPQLLLYPQSVYHRHIRHRDQWAFGVGRADCVHAVFEDYSPALTERFRAVIEENGR